MTGGGVAPAGGAAAGLTAVADVARVAVRPLDADVEPPDVAAVLAIAVVAFVWNIEATSVRAIDE
jgi:hypothetical protein